MIQDTQLVQLSLWEAPTQEETIDPFAKVISRADTCTCWQYGYHIKCPECERVVDEQWKSQLSYLKSQEYRDLEEEILSTRPRLREIVESARRETLARETPLQRLRRTRPDLSEEMRVNYVLLGCLREQVVS
jgi:hypothetical protein